MSLGKDAKSDLLRICGEVHEGSELETVLGTQIDSKLNFENYIKSLCGKVSQKLGGLQRFSNLFDAQTKSLLFNSIIKFQFRSCPLVSMFYSRRTNSLVNNLDERALWIAPDDHNDSESEFLMTKGQQTIHQQNINLLMKEIYKFEKNLSPPLNDDIFQIRKIILRHFQKLAKTYKKLSKNRSRHNNLPCTSIMDLSSNTD